MPRQARLDAPATFHHVMVRDLERYPIFLDDVDRADFVARVAALAGRARVGIACLWMTVLGHPGRPLAPALGIRPQNVYRAATQGHTAAAEWERILTTC